MSNLTENDVPMVYPYLTDDAGLRNRLIENKVFVAKYWPNVIPLEGFDVETNLANLLIPIPLDQRYGMIEIGNVIHSLMP